MNFLYPIFAIAFSALAIPIIIHLFNFKKFKKVLFSDIRFLQEIKQETNKKSQLKHYLILLSRLLALGALVFAFMQPYLGEKISNQKGSKCISIFIDNSYSMITQEKDIPLLSLAKNKAINIINNSANADQFQILTQEFSAAENRILDKQQALAAVNNIISSPQSRNINAILQKQQNILNANASENKSIVYISDFQKNKTPLPSTFKGVAPVYLVPIQASITNNVTLDSAWFETPNIQLNQPNTLNVRVINYNADKGVNTSLQLTNNGQIKTVKNVNLNAGETQLISIPYSTAQSGWQQMQLHLTDYPLSFDDTLYLAANVVANSSVLLVNDNSNNPYLNAVFRTGNNFRVDNAVGNNVKTNQFDNYSLVVLSNMNSISPNLQIELERYIQKGGNVLVFPGNAINLNNYNETIGKLSSMAFANADTSKLQVSQINKDHSAIKDLFDRIPENVDLPKCSKHYPMRASTFSTEQKIFGFSSGDAFLTQIKNGNGNIYLCASPADLNSSNFTNSYWFLPILFKIAFNSSNEPIHNYTIGKDALVQAKSIDQKEENLYHLNNEKWDAIPEQQNIRGSVQINLNNAVKNAGLYSLATPNSNNPMYVGLNYTRTESELIHWVPSDLKNKIGLTNASVLLDDASISTALKTNLGNSNIWKYCLIAALLFLLIEIILVRSVRE